MRKPNTDLLLRIRTYVVNTSWTRLSCKCTVWFFAWWTLARLVIGFGEFKFVLLSFSNNSFVSSYLYAGQLQMYCNKWNMEPDGSLLGEITRRDEKSDHEILLPTTASTTTKPEQGQHYCCHTSQVRSEDHGSDEELDQEIPGPSSSRALQPQQQVSTKTN